jgi:hypothetical protein
MNMSTPARKRANGVDLPEWWLQKVNALVDERDESMVELGKSLAVAAGRDRPWSHSIVSRFLENQNTTIDMAEAFSALLGIPQPFFVPRSLDEAIALTATAKRYEVKATTPEQSRRLAEIDALLESETRAATLDRSGRAADDDRVHAKDESRARSRRAGRRRPPPARS